MIRFNALLLLLIPLMLSCHFSENCWEYTEKVQIQLPPVHPAFALVCPETAPSYTISWYDQNGQKQTIQNVTSTITIDLPLEKMTAVRVFQETDIPSLSIALPSAGAMYPIHAVSDGHSVFLQTSWEKGLSAELAERICLEATGGFNTGRIIAEHFNWPRFDEKITTLKQPLTLNRERFIEALLSGQVTVYDITVLESFPLQISLKEGKIDPGTVFLPTWPFAPSFIWPVSNTLTIEAPEGVSHYFCASGYITLEIVNGATVCFFYSRFSLQE